MRAHRAHRLKTTAVAFVVAAVAAAACAAALAAQASAAVVKPPLYQYLAPGDGATWDTMTQLAVDDDGTLYACGTIWHDGTGHDITVTRFGDGGSGWTRTWNGPDDGHDVATAIACGADDTVFVYGSEGTGIDSQPILLQYGPDGTVRRELRRSWGVPLLLTAGPAGVVTCVLEDNAEGGGQRIVLDKYTPGGTLAWERSYQMRGYKTFTYATDIWMSDAGTVYVVGTADGTDFDRHAFVGSWTAGGTRRWVKVYDGPGRADAGFAAVAPCPRGGVYAAGHATSDARDLLLARYAADGDRTMTRRLGSGDGHAQWAADVAVDGRGRVAVCGGWRASDKGFYAALLRRDGSVVWAHNYRGDRQEGYAKHLVVDAADRVCVTGNTRGATVGSTYVAGAVATYAFSRAGTLRWWCRWPAGFDPAVASEGPSPTAIAALESSNVWVCGSTAARPGTGVDQFVLGWGL